MDENEVLEVEVEVEVEGAEESDAPKYEELAAQGLLPLRAAAALMGISAAWCRRMCREERIDHVRTDKDRIFFTMETIEQFKVTQVGKVTGLRKKGQGYVPAKITGAKALYAAVMAASFIPGAEKPIVLKWVDHFASTWVTERVTAIEAKANEEPGDEPCDEPCDEPAAGTEPKAAPVATPEPVADLGSFAPPE